MKETIIPLFAFIEQVRKTPEKQSPDERIRHFAKIYSQYTQNQAKEQSERCLDCGNPYCQWQCPVHNYIPEWLHLVADGKIMEAADLAHMTNTLPDVCGQVCPQEILCEGACTLNNEKLGSVTIGAIENYLTEKALNLGWKPDLSQVRKSPFKVAIIGAGPAGLACADKLARLGVASTVYDKHPEIGGLLTFGIPQFKLEKEVIIRRRKIFEDMGIKFVLNTPIIANAQLEALHEEFDALFLGMGADKGIKAEIPGEQLSGVYPALPFLIEQTHYVLGLKKSPPFDFTGKRVFILGAGDTAMDCSRTAIRLGAESVTCVYRRRETDRQGVKKDYLHAQEEGVTFIWQQQAVALLGTEHIEAIQCAATEINERGELVLRTDQIQNHVSDVVIIAYGFQANPEEWFTSQNIQTKDNGLVIAAEDAHFPLQTSHENIFAGGDMILGANLVVNAIAQGQKAAQSIFNYLQQKPHFGKNT